MYRGVIFDLDGTLFDTIYDLTDSLNQILASYGYPKVSYEVGKAGIGHGLRELLKFAVPEEKKQDDAFLDKATEELRAYYQKNLLNKTNYYPEIPELLQKLEDKQILYAISSNKPDTASKLIVSSLLPEANFVEVSGNLPGRKHKPDPEQTLRIAELMNLRPEEILYVGDSITDYQTAKNSGMQPVLVSYGYGQEEQNQENYPGAIFVNSPLEILDNI